MNNEKTYQFNEYVLGYDAGKNDRSCLTICKIQNDNMYVMSSLYDGSADIVSMILDKLQAENKKLNNIINKLENYMKVSCFDGTFEEVGITQSYLNILKELKGEE